MKKKLFSLSRVFIGIALVIIIFIRMSPSIAENSDFARDGQVIAAAVAMIGGFIAIGKYYSEMLGNKEDDESSNDNEEIPDDAEETDPNDNISLNSNDEHDTDK